MDGGKGRPCREGIGVGRQDLIGSFETALSASFGDPWAVGQYVYFLDKLEEPLRAREALSFWCETPEWWCHALAGYLHYSAGRGPAADEVFESMLGAMDPEARCTWKDLFFVLDAPLRQQYQLMDCDEKAAADVRIWWLGDPLWTVEGNDRRSAHFYRWIVDQLIAQLDRTGGAYMSSTSHTWNLRFGYFNAWRDITERTPPGSGIPPSHRPLRSHWYQFVPSPRLVEDPFTADEEEWGFAPPRAWNTVSDMYAESAAAQEDLNVFADTVTGRPGVFFNPRDVDRIFLEPEAYTPSYGPVTVLDAQRAVFVRGDSMRVILVSEVTDSTLLAQWNRRALLATSTSEFEPVALWLPKGADLRRSRFEYDMLLPEEPILVSAEVFTERSGAARLRYAQHPLPGRGDSIRISDILLWEPDGGFESPTSDTPDVALDDVIVRALPAERIPLGGSVEMYWELYGLEEGTPLSVSLRVVDDDPGLLRRLGGALGVAEGEPHITTTFADAVGGGDAGLAPRTLRLDAADLPTGFYRVELQIVVEAAGETGAGRVPTGAFADPVPGTVTLSAVRRFEVAVGRVGGAEPPGG